MQERITDKMVSTASKIIRLLRSQDVTVGEARAILQYAHAAMEEEINGRDF